MIIDIKSCFAIQIDESTGRQPRESTADSGFCQMGAPAAKMSKHSPATAGSPPPTEGDRRGRGIPVIPH
jgi:hypothetical protein